MRPVLTLNVKHVSERRGAAWRGGRGTEEKKSSGEKTKSGS